MFDANLCGTPTGSKVWVKFHGKVGNDKSNIQAGNYKCTVIKGGNLFDPKDNYLIAVHNPSLRKSKSVDSLLVSYQAVGNRWVTYEGHIEE
jgi:hypothetical protein